jgi:hypothetical protein
MSNFKRQSAVDNGDKRNIKDDLRCQGDGLDHPADFGTTNRLTAGCNVKVLKKYRNPPAVLVVVINKTEYTMCK